MGQLSDGQKSSVVLAKMAKENPHILFLDEPTNHLDMESIDSLAKAINKFTGGVVLVSHDMRLISQVAREILMCDNMSVTRYNGEISDFKMKLRREMSLSDGHSEAVKELAPPLPSPVLVSPSTHTTKSDSKNTEDEEIMKARLELAELAIKRQRDRQAAATTVSTTSKENGDVPPLPAPNSDIPDDSEAALKAKEKELQKAKKKAEKEAALALAA